MSPDTYLYKMYIFFQAEEEAAAETQKTLCARADSEESARAAGARAPEDVVASAVFHNKSASTECGGGWERG